MAAEESKPRQLELPDYVRILSKRKWFILVVTAVATLVGGLYALSSERMYEATSLVMVKQRPEGFFWITGEQPGMAPNVAMDTYARIARSNEVTALAADRLAQLPTDNRIIATSGEVREALEVSVIPPD
ncbi:MAG: Wzz/FepE/Etk N-terminal domain-containing protein, partial [Armatimonadota bacterium]